MTDRSTDKIVVPETSQASEVFGYGSEQVIDTKKMHHSINDLEFTQNEEIEF